MISHTPIQTPITGHEYTGDQREPIQALAQFYRAMNSRDFDLMRQNWLDSDESVMDNPLGGIKRGWDEINTTYQSLFSGKGTYWFEFYDYSLHETENLFYATGRERGELDVNGQPLQLAIRTTRVFQRDEAGRWRQIHHHGSIDDPKMLSAYQAAILGK